MSSSLGAGKHFCTQAFGRGRLTCREDPSYILLHSISLDGSRFPFLPLVSWWTPACSQCSVLCSRVTTILFQKLLLCCVPNQNLTSFWNLVYDLLTVLGPSILHPSNFTNYRSLCKPVTLRQSYESFLLAGSVSVIFSKNHLPTLCSLVFMLKYYLAHILSTE